VDSQVSTNYEPSVSVAGDGDASVPMEPYQWPAAYQQPSVWMVILVTHGIALNPWNGL